MPAAPLRPAKDHVPRRSPFPIELTIEEEQELQSTARQYTAPYRDVIRARIILYAAQGARNDDPVVAKLAWRGRRQAASSNVAL